MPNASKFRSKRKTTTRRPHKRAPAKRKSRTNRPSGPFKVSNPSDPFRTQMRVKLVYEDHHTAAVGGLGTIGSEFVYNCNSLFDPDKTGVGHQPYGFDQMALLYKRYKVNAVLVELTYSDPSEDGLTVVARFNHPGNNSVSMVGLDPTIVAEQPRTVIRTINNSGRQVGTIKQYFPIHAISGLTKLQFDADHDIFTALVGQNPQMTPEFRYAVANDRHVAGGTIVFKLRLTFYATLFERNILAPS